MPFWRVVGDENVDFVGNGVAPCVVFALILEGEVFAAAFGDLGGSVDDEFAVA